jgi:hypothetical protein
MDIAIPPPLVPAPSQGGTLPALKPGDVITAKVLQILADGMARLSLANMIVDLPTEIMLTPGSTIQLAIGGTPDNPKLALVEQLTGTAKGQGPEAPVAPAGVASGPAPTGSRVAAEPAAALSAALRSAAVRQNGLGGLFADLQAAVGVEVLPEPVRQAAARLAGLQLPAGTVTAADVKQAVARSGVFLEAKLAAAAENGAAPPPPSGDLKAALLVLRHVLKTWVDGVPATPAQGQASPTPQPGQVTQPGQAGGSTPVVGKTVVSPSGAVTPRLLSAPTPIEGPPAGSASPPMPAAVPGDQPDPPALQGHASPTPPVPPGPTLLNRPLGLPTALVAEQDLPAPPAPRSAPNAAPARVEKDAPQRLSNPPPPTAPPYRGGPLTPQPAAAPSIIAEAEPRALGERLLEDTDAAISRQTLLQGASLPEGGGRPRDAQQIRWNFEIPLATPQGTAVAQFEIARDGRGSQASRSEPVWRVRFTLDVEPMGPVHAHIALAGGKTSVALWAERPASAVRLRHDAAQLSAALREAELDPGDVLVRLGEPPRPAEAPAGRFVDRAS